MTSFWESIGTDIGIGIGISFLFMGFTSTNMSNVMGFSFIGGSLLGWLVPVWIAQVKERFKEDFK